jgi:hypothetical protein
MLQSTKVQMTATDLRLRAEALQCISQRLVFGRRAFSKFELDLAGWSSNGRPGETIVTSVASAGLNLVRAHRQVEAPVLPSRTVGGQRCAEDRRDSRREIHLHDHDGGGRTVGFHHLVAILVIAILADA